MSLKRTWCAVVFGLGSLSGLRYKNRIYGHLMRIFTKTTGHYPAWLYNIKVKLVLKMCRNYKPLPSERLNTNQTPFSITKTRLYNFDPLKPHFYIVKLGFTGVYIIFLISAQKHRLWVLVRTASARRKFTFYGVKKFSIFEYACFRNDT